MVRRGQYLERAVVIVGDPIIEGLYHRGKKPPAVLVVPPFPASGSMETPMVAEMGWALARAGCATLRFNWRGVGASGGDFDTSALVEDLEGAREQLVTSAFTDAPNLMLAAVAFGEGAHVLARRREDFGTVVLIQPPADTPPAPSAKKTRVMAAAEDADKAGAARHVAEAWGAELVLIEEADARFHRHLPQLGAEVVRTFRPRERRAYTDDD